MTRLPRSQHDGVLAGVKATPCGWPPASLDTSSGRRQFAVSGSGPPRTEIHQFQVSTVSGDCRTSQSVAVSSELALLGPHDSVWHSAG